MPSSPQLPPEYFYVTVLPMRIGGGSGAPARVVAEVDEPYPPYGGWYG